MAQFIVTTLADENDSGASVANPGGTGLSLREAVALANNAAGADTILFDQGLAGTIRLTLDEISITDDLTINGGEAFESNLITISGDSLGDDVLADGVTDLAASTAGGYLSDNTRIFTATADLTLQSLIITGGRTEGNSLFSSFSNQGGAIHV
ncbi:MAG: hypothetical protein AAFU55_16485, partial [Pseudomonadota bacterium]